MEECEANLFESAQKWVHFHPVVGADKLRCFYRTMACYDMIRKRKARGRFVTLYRSLS